LTWPAGSTLVEPEVLLPAMEFETAPADAPAVARGLTAADDDRPNGRGTVAGVVGEEGAHGVGVELGPGLAAQDVDRLLVGSRRAVGAGRSDRVEGVIDRDDPRAHGNPIARESVRIAGAVEPLVMVPDDPGELGIAERRRRRRGGA